MISSSSTSVVDSPTLARRGFVGLSAAAVAAAYGVSGAPAWAEPRFSGNPFALGVASGDPMPDGVVLWTRLAPEPLAPDGLGGMPHRQVAVKWEVATDSRFQRVVRRGVERAAPELAHSVHAEVSGLRPGRDYWYRFRVGAAISRVGRTRTAPAATSMPLQARFAVASCQARVGGPYAAYRAMAKEDLDLVVHVGDYIYERLRDETLADFRFVHGQCKTSPGLQDAHAAAAFVLTFDDHEIENNWAGNVSQPDGEESNEPGRFRRLRANAFQAYYEHLPLRRPQRPQGARIQLHRRLDYGRLLRLNVLDTRQYRTDQLTEAFPGGPLDPRASDPGQSLLGDAQERWLFSGLRRSPVRWNVLAQQTVMAQVDYDLGAGIADTPAVATEFVSTSISSNCSWADDVEQARLANPHVRYLNARQRGYCSMTVTPQQWRTDYRVLPSATDADAPAVTDSSWVVENGRAGAQAG